MDISISCELFVRLAGISNALLKGEKRTHLRSIYLESVDGNAFAVASNSIVGAIECLGVNCDVDCEMLISVTDTLVEQCKAEIPFDGQISFHFNPVLKFISAKTSLGYVHTENAGLFIDDHELKKWREWIPEELPKKTNGGMFSTLDNLALLASVAPTGSVIFPKFIDIEKPVIVRDVHDENWLGVFMPLGRDKKRALEPLTIPEWAK